MNNLQIKDIKESWEIEDQNYIWVLRTTQVATLTKLFDALKDMLTNTTMEIRPDGMQIVDFNFSVTTMIDCFLKKDNFDWYTCKRDSIKIGINIPMFYTMLKSVKSTDNLVICIQNKHVEQDGNISDLTMIIQKKSRVRTKEIKLQSPDREKVIYPSVQYDVVFSFAISDFVDVIKNMKEVSKLLTIKHVGNELIFSANGQFSTEDDCHQISNITNHNSATAAAGGYDPRKIICNKFSIRNLNSIVKCKEINSVVLLMISADLPLTANFEISNLGRLNLSIGVYLDT